MSRVGGMKQTSDIAFSSDWLALREPADHAARDPDLLARAGRAVATGASVLDLGSGTGSTVRAFEQAGFHNFNWHLFDNDAGLLDRATMHHPSAGAVIGDLGDVDKIPLDGIDLVTASALLDLMSLAWVERLAKRVFAANLPLYAALNYDGVMHWTPPSPQDESVTQHFNSHQQREKGNGIALGPTSTVVVPHLLRTVGFDVTIGPSPWHIGPDQSALHLQLLDGIADAVAEIDQSGVPHWYRARTAAVSHTQAYVGHMDILAVPARSNQ